MLLPSTLCPSTLTTTSLAGLIGFKGLETWLVSLRTSLTSWVAVFVTT